MTVGTFFARGARRRSLPALCRGAAAAALLLAVAACGGGDPVNEFRPQRLLVLGDESSLITDGGSSYPATLPDGVTAHPKAGQLIPAGLKYSVNGLDPVASPPVDNAPPGPVDCRAGTFLLWVQVVADQYGFGFDECNNEPAGTPQRGTIYAKAGARVADLAAQIAEHQAGSSFVPSDLVTVLIGQHDVLDIYAGVASAAQCVAAAGTARAQGTVLAGQINGIARDGQGGRVLFVTVPLLGETPFARQQPADFDRRACLNQLTDAFNAGLRFGVVNDGRQIGLVAIDEQVRLIVDDPDRFGYENVSDAACLAATPLPDCSTETLQDAAKTSDFMWADDRHFGHQLHRRLGDIAASRLRNDLPF